MLTFVLILIILALMVVIGALGYFFAQNNKKLARYDSIDDAEAFRDKCFRETQKLKDSAAQLDSQIQQYKNQATSWARLLEITKPAVQAKEKFDELNNEIQRLKIEHGLISDKIELQEAGFFERRFEFDFPEPAQRKLEEIVNKQKAMIQSGSACTCSIEWVVGGDSAAGRKMIKEQIKLMLRAFNGESDAAIAKVKFNNLPIIEKRIVQCFDSLNKLGATKKVSFSAEFLDLKISELHLQYAYAKAKEAERERQREIAAQIREEQKAEREIEDAKRKAEKEERLKAKALEDAKKELASLQGQANAELAARIARLEGELSEAIANKSRAIARAQMTKSGHVYVLSNIGTMGKSVFKIGMTRRYEPEDRVRELGDASVPFPFDIHAMIFSANAPKLENELHRHFHNRRVNLVNLKREYFHVTIEEVREAVKTLYGDAIFNEVPTAEEFWESESLRKKIESEGTTVRSPLPLH